VKYIVLTALFYLLPTFVFADSSAVPKVVVSIAPLHALVRSVLPEEHPPILLVESHQSPHIYQLKPSQMRELQQADLVIWIGESLEGFLSKSLASLPAQVKTLALLNDRDLIRLSARTGGAWEKHDDHEHHGHHGHHGHGHEQDKKAQAEENMLDPHIWLSPENAKQIVRQVARELAALDPARADDYLQKAEQAVLHLASLDDTLQQQLQAIREKPYIVFHDAYFYFENHYQLNPVGSITVSPESRPSAKRLHQLRQRIKQLNVQCVFSEPQFKSHLVTTIIEGTTAKAGVLDPLSIDSTQAGIVAYSALLQNLANQLLACLE
jgi:zinc transport system substrate-binding protein